MVDEMGFYSAWALANGVRTHYSWSGTEGPAVVLLHGGGPGASGAGGWRYMLPALAESGFRAYAPDQLSMGLTDARPHAWPVLGHQSLVDHIRDFIDALCLDSVYVVGNSQGAYVAAKLTLDHPELVRKAFFVGSGTIASAMGLQGIDPNNPGVIALRDYDYSEEAMRTFLQNIVHDASTVTDELVRSRHEMANRPGVGDSRKAFADYQVRMRKDPALLRRFELRDALPKFGRPARFIWGREDRFAPAEIGHQLEKMLPDIRFEYIDDAGHQCQTDQPEVVNQMVIDFFQNSEAEV